MAIEIEPPTQADIFTLFVSSGADVVNYRDYVSRVIGVLAPQLIWEHAPFRIEAVRWEDVASQRHDVDLNQLFVQEAVRCTAAIVLLRNELRPGTREELEAVLETPDTDVSLIQIGTPEDEQDPAWLDLKDFLSGRRQNLLYRKILEETQESVEDAILQVIFRILMRINSVSRR